MLQSGQNQVYYLIFKKKKVFPHVSQTSFKIQWVSFFFLRAVLALKQSKTKVEAILQGKDLIMTFHGIGQFNNQVIYVKMSEENQKMLCRIAGKCLI